MIRLTHSAAYAMLWLVVAFQAVLILALLRRLEDLRGLLTHVDVPIDGALPATGNPAPAFESKNRTTGESITLDSLQGASGILLFVSSKCGSCRQLVSQLGSLTSTRGLIILCEGEEIANHVAVDAIVGIHNVGDAIARYRIKGFPTAVVLGADLRIAGYIQAPTLQNLEEHLSDSLAAPHADTDRQLSTREAPIASLRSSVGEV